MKIIAGEKTSLQELLSLNSASFNRFLRLWESAHRLRADSRTCNRRTLFYARKGWEHDGHSFIPELIDKCQVVGVLADASYPKQSPKREKKIIRIPGLNTTKLVAGKLAEIFYHQPSHKLRMVGITGTDGKTTTSSILAQGYASWGYPTAIIGTNGIRICSIGSKSFKALLTDLKIPCSDQPNTTPDPIVLQEVLYYFLQHSIKTVVMEVSSHGVAMGRVNEIAFDSMVWTNLSPEHLDYHKTLEEYAFAKARAFGLLKKSLHSVKSLQTRHTFNTLTKAIALRESTAIVGLDSLVELYRDSKNRSWIARLIKELCDRSITCSGCPPTWFIHQDSLEELVGMKNIPGVRGFKKSTPTPTTTMARANNLSLGSLISLGKLVSYGQSYMLKSGSNSKVTKMINRVMVGNSLNIIDIINTSPPSTSPRYRYVFDLDLIGHFNAQNFTAATLELEHFHNTGAQKPEAPISEKNLKRLATIWKKVQVKGRLEVFSLTRYTHHPEYRHLKLGLIYIDYAHTAEALKKALTALHPLTCSKHTHKKTTPNRKHSKKLIVVFGAGGDRDKQKRFTMGKVSAQLADITIVSDDNPRTEAPELIRAKIVQGWKAGFKVLSPKNQSQKQLEVIPGRRAALARMLELLQEYPGAVVLLAGKGHEDYQIIGKTKHPFDERVVLHELLVAKSKADSLQL